VARFVDGRRVWETIRSIKPAGVATVYNLEVAPPHTYIAGSFIVHNKGGGFSGSYGGGYSGYGGYSSYGSYGGYGYGRRSWFSNALTFGLAIAVLLMRMVLYIAGRRKEIAPPADALLPDGRVGERAGETLAIIRSLAASTPALEPGGLEDFVRGTFMRVQAAWQACDYSPVREAMAPELYAEHCAKVEAMKDRGERDVMEGLQVLHVDFVHVRRPPESEEGASFTALITASAKDYIVNDESGFRRTLDAPAATFQEFWTFYRKDGSWLLSRIDQTAEADTVLNAPNLPGSADGAAARPFSAPSVPGVTPSYEPYQPPSSAGAAAAPAMAALDGFAPREEAPAAPENDWDRQKLEIAATLAFEGVYSAWGANDAARISPDLVAPEALARLKKIFDGRKAEGITLEFRDFFTRRAEVVLTTPAAQPAGRDEFTARLTGTAVRTLLRHGKPLSRDDGPRSFTEYWVFSRLDAGWKMSAILPRMDQEKDATGDGAPTPAQLEWYWESGA
jgi:predicted lipid-binding transport protein (Tim44 family)